jgi:hypothetical protein
MAREVVQLDHLEDGSPLCSDGRGFPEQIYLRGCCFLGGSKQLGIALAD